MAYIDYSNNWVLDQFLTFLQANQLGANCEHLYDSLAVEHNINTSTVDGTHKANSITGSMINTTPITATSQTIPGLSAWTPTVGVYQVAIVFTFSGFGGYPNFEIYVSGTWRKGSVAFNSDRMVFCDGSNMRFYNYSETEFAAPGNTATVYYQKF